MENGENNSNPLNNNINKNNLNQCNENNNNSNQQNNANKEYKSNTNEVSEKENIKSNLEQNKLDWKELEKWNNIKESELENRYGVDITKLGKDNKKIDVLTKILSIIVKTFYIIGKGAVILAIIIGLIWVINTFTSAPEMLIQLRNLVNK